MPKAGKGGAKGGLGSLMGSFDITKMIPTGPEYPTGKTTLADYYDGGSGAYPAGLLTEPTLPKHTIYAPKTPPPKNVKMPVLIWGNGGCTSSGTPYGLFLTNIASHGYLAIANGWVNAQVRKCLLTTILVHRAARHRPLTQRTAMAFFLARRGNLSTMPLR